MLGADLKRIIRAGFLSFWRNGFVSLASILNITIALFLIGSLIFFSALMSTSLEQIRNKVDIDVYFVTSASSDDILALKASLEELPEVALVVFTSRDEALAQFRERHANDFLTLQALEELDENPLRASLNIRAQETSQYESIARFIENQNEAATVENQIIDDVNYYQNKIAIDRLAKFITNAQGVGFAIVIAIALIAVINTFNTVRLAIYTSREEISVMRLVGANNKYIRGPFIIEGFFCGIVSAFFVLILFYPLTFWLGGMTERFFGGMNIFTYYLQNFGQVSLIILSSGILLGVVSSYFAVRRYIVKKYLKV